MWNEEILHSPYGGKREAQDDGNVGSVFLLLQNGGEERGRFGSFAKGEGERVSPSSGGAKRVPDGAVSLECLTVSRERERESTVTNEESFRGHGSVEAQLV